MTNAIEAFQLAMNAGRCGGACGSVYIGPIMKAEFEDILTSNQFLSWRHPNLQEITSPIYSGITFNEWNAKHLPDQIIFSCSKFLIILHRFQYVEC